MCPGKLVSYPRLKVSTGCLGGYVINSYLGLDKPLQVLEIGSVLEIDELKRLNFKDLFEFFPERRVVISILALVSNEFVWDRRAFEALGKPDPANYRPSHAGGFPLENVIGVIEGVRHLPQWGKFLSHRMNISGKYFEWLINLTKGGPHDIETMLVVSGVRQALFESRNDGNGIKAAGDIRTGSIEFVRGFKLGVEKLGNVGIELGNLEERLNRWTLPPEVAANELVGDLWSLADGCRPLVEWLFKEAHVRLRKYIAATDGSKDAPT